MRELASAADQRRTSKPPGKQRTCTSCSKLKFSHSRSPRSPCLFLACQCRTVRDCRLSGPTVARLSSAWKRPLIKGVILDIQRAEEKPLKPDTYIAMFHIGWKALTQKVTEYTLTEALSCILSVFSSIINRLIRPKRDRGRRERLARGRSRGAGQSVLVWSSETLLAAL